jgi:hypothetical protein
MMVTTKFFPRQPFRHQQNKPTPATKHPSLLFSDLPLLFVRFTFSGL